MSKKRDTKGHCCICGEFKKLSFEHVPPESAFNDKPIFMQSDEHLTDQNSYVYGKKMRSNRGFGGYTLCESCNKNTGSWYANDFANFAHQGMKIVKGIKPLKREIKGLYTLKPLNVCKQIIAMFMSADKSGYLSSKKELVDFVLNKELIGLPENYRVYLYSTLSSRKRLLGFCAVFDSRFEGIQKWSEINFQPFGYFFTENSNPPHSNMCDITEFGMFSYDQEVSCEITTMYLNIPDFLIGTYT